MTDPDHIPVDPNYKPSWIPEHHIWQSIRCLDHINKGHKRVAKWVEEDRKRGKKVKP